MEQELFFIFILIIVIFMIILNIKSSKTKSKFIGSKNNLRDLAEHLKNSNNLNDLEEPFESDLETESDFDSDIEDRDNSIIEEELNISKEESTVNKCCTVDCESCEFRTSKNKNLCNNPNILIDGVNDVMYKQPVIEVNEEKQELYSSLIPEPERIDYIRYKMDENNNDELLNPLYLTLDHENYIKRYKYERN